MLVERYVIMHNLAVFSLGADALTVKDVIDANNTNIRDFYDERRSFDFSDETIQKLKETYNDMRTLQSKMVAINKLLNSSVDEKTFNTNFPK